jgi:hypothetical protein
MLKDNKFLFNRGVGEASRFVSSRRAKRGRFAYITPPAHFRRNPPRRGQLAVFPSPRRIDLYESRYGRFTASPAWTALKNSQLTRRPPGDLSHYMRSGAPERLTNGEDL